MEQKRAKAKKSETMGNRVIVEWRERTYEIHMLTPQMEAERFEQMQRYEIPGLKDKIIDLNLRPEHRQYWADGERTGRDKRGAEPRQAGPGPTHGGAQPEERTRTTEAGARTTEKGERQLEHGPPRGHRKNALEGQARIETRWRDRKETGWLDGNTTEDSLIAGMRTHFQIPADERIVLSHWVIRYG
jgi:hypothetical protein